MSQGVVRTSRLLALPASIRPFLFASRPYATQTGLGTTSASEQPRRKAVNVLNDDGRVPWGNLSPAEKMARTTQQSFNLSFILLGAVLTVRHLKNSRRTQLSKKQGGVAYVMYTEVFSLDSKTAHFNRAVDRVKNDPKCVELLGDSKKIYAHGEPTWNKWARARPIA